MIFSALNKEKSDQLKPSLSIADNHFLIYDVFYLQTAPFPKLQAEMLLHQN